MNIERTNKKGNISVFLLFLLLLPLGMAACSEGAYADELDFTVSERITMTADGSRPELMISGLMIENHSDETYIGVDRIEVTDIPQGWNLVPESTDFVNLACNSRQISLSTENHDFFHGAYCPASLQITPGTSESVQLSGKTGAVTAAVEDLYIGNLTVTVSLAGTAVPEGCTYKIYKSGEVRNPGDLMPAAASRYDVFTTADYTYKMGTAGWELSVKNVTQTEYEPIYSSIAGADVCNMNLTFKGCSQMVRSPEIPAGVTAMYSTYYGCTMLEEVPVLPQGITKLEYTFQNCKSLREAPVIPASVTDMTSAFCNCPLLTEAPEIPYGVTILKCTFQSCKGLTQAPAIPDTVTNLYYTFYGCSSLAAAPEIPYGAEDMTGTFYSCKALTQAPEIPATVTNLNYTFFSCSQLTGILMIHGEPAVYNNFLTGTSKEILIDGTCSDEIKALLAATANKGNVTWVPSAAQDESEGMIADEEII